VVEIFGGVANIPLRLREYSESDRWSQMSPTGSEPPWPAVYSRVNILCTAFSAHPAQLSESTRNNQGFGIRWETPIAIAIFQRTQSPCFMPSTLPRTDFRSPFLILPSTIAFQGEAEILLERTMRLADVCK